MNYSNSLKGLKKIRLSELLSIITAFLLMLAAILSIQVQENGTEGIFLWGRGVQFLTACAGLLGLIAGLMQLAGTFSAGKETMPFHTAFLVSLASLIVSIFVNSFGPEEEAKTVFNYCQRLISLFVLLLIIKGVIVLAEQMNDGEMIAEGKKTKPLLIILFAFSFIGDIVLSGVLQRGALPVRVILTVAVSGFGIAVSAVVMVLLRKAIELLESVQEPAAGQVPEEMPEETPET